MPDGVLEKSLDSNKIYNLGWKPKTTINEGIKKTLDFFENTK